MTPELSRPAFAPEPVGAGDLFAELAHQPQAVEHLRHALAGGHVAHAYAFVGPHGSGRKAAALAFATALVTRDAGAGARTAADRVARGVHPDVHLIQPTPLTQAFLFMAARQQHVAQVIGPALAGALLVPIGVGAPLIAGGVLKTVYDVSLYAFFRSRPTPEEALMAPPKVS